MRRKRRPVGDAALLQAARVAEEDAARHRPSAAQKQQQISELEERVAAEFGDPVKQSAQAKVLERKWLRFLVHGETYIDLHRPEDRSIVADRHVQVLAPLVSVIHSTIPSP